MKYLRTYPWGFRLLLFMLMVFTFFWGGWAIVAGVFTRFTGYALTDLVNGITPSSPFRLVKSMLYLQGFQNAFIFGLPAFVFAYLTHPSPAAYLGLRKPSRPIHLLLGPLIMLGAAPLLMLVEQLIGLFNFGPEIKAAQEANEQMIKAFLNMPRFPDFIATLLVIAVIPGIGEELLFRGVLMRFARQRSRGMTMPILFSAAVFAMVHANIYGIISIFAAGALLAVIYQLTGSVWCSIISHFSFNGLQVVLYYLAGNNAAVKSFVEASNLPVWIVFIGMGIFLAALWALYRSRTPLPVNWADDFAGEQRED